MAQLMLHKHILKNFNKLPGKVQKRVSEVVEEFQNDPHSPAIGLHPLKAQMLDPKVRGIKNFPDGYRGIVIVPEQGDTYLLVHIDKHDAAYKWAANKRFEVHAMTGVFQVFDTEETESKALEHKTTDHAAGNYRLNELTDEELFTAGVPLPLIPAVRNVYSDESLTALSEYLPPDCRDILIGYAAGMTLDEAISEMLGLDQATPKEKGFAPGDFSRIQDAPNYDLVLVEGQEELKKILDSPLDEWRIFLHPYQRKLVQWQTKGPMNITGAAGTGKTVALMHRAVYLARRLEDPKAKVLVTTFTSNLYITIKQHLKQLGPDVAERIETINLHNLARTICKRQEWNGRIADEDELNQIWEEVLQNYGEELPMPAGEMRAEYDDIIDPNGIDDEEAYLGTIRSGRPRITRKQRKAAWKVFLAVQRAMKRRKLATHEGVVHQARLAAERGHFPVFAHVLVDEVQDFSLEALRLIRAISSIDAGTPDPLCTAGDGHQRIYRTKVPMSRAKIDIRGRSRRLKINYRTSEQIRLYAQAILRGEEIDDLDGSATTTIGDHSVMSGPEPEVQHCATEADEAKSILQWVKKLTEEQGFPTEAICVTPYKQSVRSALNDAGIATFELKPNEEDPGPSEPGVRLGTMKRIKGLEFRAVALACADPKDPLNHLATSDLRLRCERYVAASRARERLFVATAG